MNRIVIIGGGTIGEILIKATTAIWPTATVSVVEPTKERAQYLKATYGIEPIVIESDTIPLADVVMCAVKPQHAETVANQLPSQLKKPLLVSVMAGISSSRLHELFGSKRIIRTMPNTPAVTGMGMTAWMTTKAATNDDEQFATQLLSHFGKQIKVSNDDMIDKATAVSGSGPAYLFLMAELLTTAAVQLGLTQKEAALMVTQTIRGSAELLATDESTAEELRKRVTSKGGTTEAAISSIPLEELQSIWTGALAAAYARARELNS